MSGDKPVICLCDRCAKNLVFGSTMTYGYVTIRDICDDCRAKVEEAIGEAKPKTFSIQGRKAR